MHNRNLFCGRFCVWDLAAILPDLLARWGGQSRPVKAMNVLNDRLQLSWDTHLLNVGYATPCLERRVSQIRVLPVLVSVANDLSALLGRLVKELNGFSN